eukprot:gene43-58_t
MILVGFAWNLCFAAGTVMLTISYRVRWRVNDFILFTVAGAGSLISGVMYADLGWTALILFVSALMILYYALFAVVWFFSVKTTGPHTVLSVTHNDPLDHQNLLSDQED